MVGAILSVIGTKVYQRLNPIQPPAPVIPAEFPVRH
jgi:hypothetical protein